MPRDMNAPAADFDAVLRRHDFAALHRDAPRVLQVNLGKLCNQACHHCHVDAGPRRTESMSQAAAERVAALAAGAASVDTVDITGGAPELNPSFRYLVERARAAGRHVVVRCNLTVLFASGLQDLPGFYRDHGVELVCSLPCYTAENVDAQRGRGVFDQSIAALRSLNDLGYGRPDTSLTLNLVYNPLGAFLPPPQRTLEAKYRDELRSRFGIEFGRLLTITNMPISRFGDQLRRLGQFDAYMGLLVNHFNPATVPGLMCRTLVSVGWDGALYDCDFNQMLELPVPAGGSSGGVRPTIWDVGSLDELGGRRIATGTHCFGCSAGAGSSCGGALQ